MSTLDEIKAAAVQLNPDEQVELFRWWVETDTFKQRQLAALKRDLAVGIEQLDGSRYQNCDRVQLLQLAEEIGRSGREQLKSDRKKTSS